MKTYLKSFLGFIVSTLFAGLFGEMHLSLMATASFVISASFAVGTFFFLLEEK